MSTASIRERVRSRPLIDKIMLVAAVLALLLGVARFARIAALFPYAAYNLSQKSSTKSVAEVVAKHRYFRDWWGGRRVPYQAGGDYLKVVEHHSANRTLGTVLATVIERQRADGSELGTRAPPTDGSGDLADPHRRPGCAAGLEGTANPGAA